MMNINNRSEWKKRNEWRKRRIRFWFYRSFVGKIYYKLEELIWLGICVGILVIILKMFFSPF